MLEVHSVWKFFGKTIALRNVTLNIPPRSFHLLLGPNGSGKTTLLKLWTGLIKPSKGEVITLGMDPWKNRSKVMKYVNVAFEDLVLPWWTTGIDYLRYYASVKNIKWSEVKELAEYFGVDKYWNRIIRGYSSGMRKKIILIQALVGEPEIIILDEPYPLLDKQSIQKLNVLLKEHSKSKTIIIASHVLAGVEKLVTSLAILINGTKVFDSRVEELKQHTIITYECKSQKPWKAVKELSSRGIIDIEIRGNNIIFTTSKEFKLSELEELDNCKTILNIEKLYVNVLRSYST